VDVYSESINDETTRRTILENCGNASLHNIASSAYAYTLGEYKLYDSELLSKVNSDYEEDDILYHKYSYELGALRDNPLDHNQVVATGKALSDILVKTIFKSDGEKRSLWFDSDACFRLVIGYISNKYKAHFLPRDKRRREWSVAVAKDIVCVSMAACRLGQVSVNKVLNGYQGCTDSNPQWEKLAAWNQAFEYLQMRSTTPELKEANILLREQRLDVPIELFNISSTQGRMMSGAEVIYRILGLFIIVYSDDVFILDYSALDQVHACAKFWEGAYNYCINYRISGSLESRKSDMLSALVECINWITQAMLQTNYSESLARSMKQSLAYLPNGFHAKSEKLEMGLEDRAKELQAAIEDILHLKKYWHEFISELNLTDRAKLDIAHLYYGLPAPDCDLELLIRATEYMASAKTVGNDTFEEFMNYCKALDFCKVLVRLRSLDHIGYKCQEGYDPSDKKWFKECCKGNLSLPPDEEMGNIWLDSHFPYNECIHTWFYEAADVTHVTSRVSDYEDLLSSRSIERVQHNKLMYALKYAPYLSTKWSTHDILQALDKGSDCWDRMVVMAAKSENTEVRENWSADDITRELTTMYDRQGIPLSAYYKGVTARKSDLEVNAIFDRVCEVTDPKNSKIPLVISNDISGWSPQGDRSAWSKHHDYVVHTTKAPKYLKLENIWRNMYACLSKRGLVAKHELPKAVVPKLCAAAL
jgi:hypothetical protein